MIDGKVQSKTDEVLNEGDRVIDRAEKQKGFPSLNGLESTYNLVRLSFDQHFDRKLVNIARVLGPGQTESSSDMTTASASFFPPFSFNEDEDVVQMDVVASNMTQPVSQDNGLNLSNISFNEITSPCNDSLPPKK